jgi:hypothetical protein
MDVLADTRDLPRGRPQAGDRHLNFHENRDNLAASPEKVCRVDSVFLG